MTNDIIDYTAQNKPTVEVFWFIYSHLQYLFQCLSNSGENCF